LASLCLLDELLNGVVHDVASDEPRITPLAYMIIRDATDMQQASGSMKILPSKGGLLTCFLIHQVQTTTMLQALTIIDPSR